MSHLIVVIAVNVVIAVIAVNVVIAIIRHYRSLTGNRATTKKGHQGQTDRLCSFIYRDITYHFGECKDWRGSAYLPSADGEVCLLCLDIANGIHIW